MKRFSLNGNLIAAFFIVIALVMVIMNLGKYDFSQKELGEEKIEEIIRYYATTCYALEGSYPSDLQYLKDNYGLIIDEKQYYYYYEGFASNVLPDIKVLRKGNKEAADE